MEVIEDLVAEQDRIEAMLAGLSEEQWLTESAAAGWTVADVVLHLAQSEEGVMATVAAGGSAASGATAGGSAAGGATAGLVAGGVDEAMDRLVQAERAAPDVVFERWRAARRAAVEALRAAPADVQLTWVAMSLKPRTLATTRLAEHWAHGLDVATPLGLPFPDTDRLRHVAWLGHATLPYAFALAGEAPRPVLVELTGPGGGTWRYGPPDAESAIRGDAGAFCRVGARRLAAAESGLTTTGPHAAAALRVLRNYAA